MSKSKNSRPTKRETELTAKIAELEKQLVQERGYKDMYSNSAKKAEEELSQIHAAIDSFPGALPRETAEESQYQRTRYSVLARLTAWLANRAVAKA